MEESAKSRTALWSVSAALVELAPLIYCCFYSRPALLSLPSAGPYYRHYWVPHVWKIKHRTSAPILTVVWLPGLKDRVLSKCSDAHIYLDQETCSSFWRWQSSFVSSRIWGSVSVGRVAKTLKANRVTWLRRNVLWQGSQGLDGAVPGQEPQRWALHATDGG